MVSLIQPKTFVRSGEGAISSYSYTDIISGTGIVVLYAGKTTASYRLSNNTWYSDGVFVSYVSGESAVFAKVIDLDFDVYVNRPMQIGGYSITNLGLKNYSTGGGGTPTECYAVVKVRKWTGSVETDLVTSADSTHLTASGAGTTYKELAIDATIPSTVFKRGEYIRLTVEVWAKSDEVGSKVGLAYDPMNRTTDWDATGVVPSTLKFQLPVKIDI
jgi:hypothetical protein